MKFLFVSEAGDSMGIALRLIEEGNEVAIWLRDDEASKRGEGLVPRIHNWEFEPDADTVYVFDCTGSGFLASLLRKSGHFVVGGSHVADRLEMDRSFAQDVMKEHGIKTPKSKLFTDWDKAKEFVGRTDERLVFKPSGELSGVVPSYVAHDSVDMLKTLEHHERQHHGQPEFVLQEFVKGIALSTEGWFNGTKFLRPFNHTIERKHLMNGDIGPSGGCTGNVVWSSDELGEDVLVPLEPFLAQHNYNGPIDLNAILTEDGLYGLEFTPRFGYDATPTLLWWLLDGEVGGFLSDFARNQSPRDMQLRSGFAAGVRLTVSPWPAEKHEGPEGLPIRGLRGRDFGQFYPYDVMLNKSDGEYVTCGAYGIVGVAGGYGLSIESAFDESYRIAEKVRVPGVQYRTDLTEVFKKDYRKCNALIAA